MKLDNLMKRGNIRLEGQLLAEQKGIDHLNDLEKQEKGHTHAVNMAIRGQAYARELKRIDIEMEQKKLDLQTEMKQVEYKYHESWPSWSKKNSILKSCKQDFLITLLEKNDLLINFIHKLENEKG